MKLYDYMKKVEGIYKELAPEYIKAVENYKNIRDAIIATRNNRDLTEQGKKKRIEQLQEENRVNKAEMEALAATAEQRAQEVRKQVEKAFYNRYHANPEALDMKVLELLKSGILTDTELKNLASQYSDNATMQRIAGKYMEQRPDRELQQTGRYLQQSASDPHLRCIDGVITIGRYCMGGAPLSGSAGAARMFERFDDMAAETYAAAPDISD